MACEIVSEIVESGVDVNDESIQDLSFDALEHLILSGLMEAGDVSDDGFSPWNVEPADALNIIKTEWRKLDGPPSLGDVCWLRNTALGEEIGRKKAHR